MENRASFRRFVPFLRSAHGGSIIEFAIVAPVLFLLLIGFIELGMIFFTYSVMEGATGINSRTGKTGFPTYNTAPERTQLIRDRIRQFSFGYIDNSNLVITVLAYRSFENVGQPEPCVPPTDPAPCVGGFNDINGNGQWDADQGRADAGGSGEVVVYRVTYPWQIFTPLMSNLLGDAQGKITLTAAATVRNERF